MSRPKPKPGVPKPKPGVAGRSVRETGSRYRVRTRRDAPPVRVNARLDSAGAEKLYAIMERTGKSVTEVLKAALEAYFAGLEAQRRPGAQELALRVGLVGCGDGPEDLSSRYKNYLSESLAGKHDHR
jgi:hypothetical protein